jgi:hypothetical protein
MLIASRQGLESLRSSLGHKEGLWYWHWLHHLQVLLNIHAVNPEVFDCPKLELQKHIDSGRRPIKTENYDVIKKYWPSLRQSAEK